MSDNRPVLTMALNPVSQSGTRDPNYFEVYANNVKIAFNPNDLSLIFGVIDNLANLQSIMRDLATVRIAPIQFKLLAHTLMAHLEAWEHHFGEIRLPEGYRTNQEGIALAYERMSEIL
jgi:hypothetical protein